MPALAQPPDASPSGEQIARWIDELGDDSYTVRQSAAERLVSGGFAARAALEQVVDGPDPETRSAARRLLTLIGQTEFSRLLAEFAADVDGRRGVTLPGWKEFGKLVGHDEAARALFVEMQREEGPLLEQMFHHSAPGGDPPWEDRLTRLLGWRVINRQGQLAAPLGSCATMYFLGSLPDAKMSDLAATYLARLAHRPPVSEAMNVHRDESAVRRLVIAWVVHCPNWNDQVLNERLDLIFRYELTEALPLALGIARREPQYLTAQPARRVTAVLAVGRFGSAKDVPALEPLLVDDAEYLLQTVANLPQGPVYSVEVRDVALAIMLHLTGQKPQDYGFVHARRHPLTVFDVTSLGMENDERRAAAAAQWRAWRVEHDLDPAPAR